MRLRNTATFMVFLLLPFLLKAGDLRGRIADFGDGAIIAVKGIRPPATRKHFPPPKKHGAIDQKDMRFSPTILPVLVGTTVDFPNSEQVIYHHVWSPSDGNTFDLGTFPIGETRSVTFKSPGIVEILCSIHTRMYAAVIVLENPYFAIADDAGKYKIPAIPAGEYEVEIYICKNKEVITRKVRVTVPVKGEVELNF